MNKALHKILLLDTHIFLWLLNGSTELQAHTINTIEKETQSGTPVKISVMSVWEIGMLVETKRISFKTGIHAWLSDALGAKTGIAVAPLTVDIALASSHLPGTFHGDPVDRIIVATAQSLGATLITRDKQIIQYAKKERLRLISV